MCTFFITRWQKLECSEIYSITFLVFLNNLKSSFTNNSLQLYSLLKIVNILILNCLDFCFVSGFRLFSLDKIK